MSKVNDEVNYQALARYTRSGNNTKLEKLLKRSSEYDVLPEADIGRYIALAAKGQHWKCIEMLFQYYVDHHLSKYEGDEKIAQLYHGDYRGGIDRQYRNLPKDEEYEKLVKLGMNRRTSYLDVKWKLLEALEHVKIWAPDKTAIPQQIMNYASTIESRVSSDSDDDRGLGKVDGFTYDVDDDASAAPMGENSAATSDDDC